MATRFDAFTGPEVACLFGSLSVYERSQAYQGNLCLASGPAPSRTALLGELLASANATTTNFPDAGTVNIGSDYTAGT